MLYRYIPLDPNPIPEALRSEPEYATQCAISMQVAVVLQRPHPQRDLRCLPLRRTGPERPELCLTLPSSRRWAAGEESVPP